MSPHSFDQFKADAKARGFDEVIERVWGADVVLAEHGHPFAVEAVVVKGEMWLTLEGDTRRLRAGQTFAIVRDVPHAERYGAEGATVWVARRHAA